MLGTDHLSLAEAAFAQRKFSEAAEHARQALAAGLDAGAYPSERGEYVPLPEAAQAELVLGMALLELGDSDAALSHLDQAVRLDRENARTWANRGHVRRERDELVLALADLSQAIERNPGYGFARFRRAQCYVALGRAPEAEADLEVLLTPNPFDAEPLALWQALRERRGASNDPSALPAPRDFGTLFARASAFLQHGLFERAIADYDAAFALHPLLLVRAYRGMAHQRFGNLQMALQDLEAYAASDANNDAVNDSLRDVRARLAIPKG